MNLHYFSATKLGCLFQCLQSHLVIDLILNLQIEDDIMDTYSFTVCNRSIIHQPVSDAVLRKQAHMNQTWAQLSCARLMLNLASFGLSFLICFTEKLSSVAHRRSRCLNFKSNF